MRCLRRIGRALIRKPSSEARAAADSAEASLAQANADYATAAEDLAEAQQIVEALRAHNASNRYDEWIRRVLAQ